jgi:hypothetical protein
MADENLVLVALRVSRAQLDKVEDWRRSQRRIPCLTGAVRALLDVALDAETRSAAGRPN